MQGESRQCSFLDNMAKCAVRIKPTGVGNRRAGGEKETGGELGAPPPVTHLPTEGGSIPSEEQAGDEG
jgi:hypothetical protein